MYEATRPEEAEVVVEIDFSVGPRRMKVCTEPVEPGFVDPRLQQAADEARGTGSNRVPMLKTRDGKVQMLVGATLVTGTPVHEKQITVVAREAVSEDGSDQAGTELWRVQATVESEGSEIAEALPVLVAVAADRIGLDTDKQEIVRIAKNAEVVTVVESGR
jgi:hypothetical protein